LAASVKTAGATTADTNIIQQIRDLKASKLSQLSQSIDNTKRELALSRRARVLTKHELEQNPRPHEIHAEYRHGQWVEMEYKNKQWVEKDKNPRKKDVLVFHYKQEKQDKLDELQSSLKTMQSRLDRLDANDMNVIIDEFQGPFHVGTIGRIDTIPYDTGSRILRLQQEVRIIGIINDHKSIVDITYRSEAVPGSPPHDYKKTFWLKGVSTVGLVDRSSIATPPFLIITGTRDYETVLGAKQTVFVMEPLEIPPNW
jgi:hypothetical protein